MWPNRIQKWPKLFSVCAGSVVRSTFAAVDASTHAWLAFEAPGSGQMELFIRIAACECLFFARPPLSCVGSNAVFGRWYVESQTESREAFVLTDGAQAAGVGAYVASSDAH